MRAVGPAGWSSHGYFGRQAKTFGNPLGASSGDGGTNPAGGGGGSVLTLTIAQDYIDDAGANGAGLFISQLMTLAQQTDWVNGVYTSMNLAGSPATPARGYWIIAGFSPPSVPAAGGQTGENALEFDVLPATSVALNIDSSLLHFYAGAGSGGSADPTTFGAGGDGGNAIQLDPNGGVYDIAISNTNGAHAGRIFGGGGAGGSGSGNGGDTESPCGGGGGAAGWFAGAGGEASGGTTANEPGVDGGVFDANNGGTNDPAVPGGLGGTIGGTGAAAGGGMGSAGGNATASGGAAGFAVFRGGGAGVTVITGAGPGLRLGPVQ